MYHLFIATPEKVAFDGDVESTLAPGAAGYLEILTDHAPIVCALVSGKVTIKDAKGKKSTWAISGGYLESSENKATILADTIELAPEIDLARAERAQKRAEKRLESNDPDIDVPRAKEALERAKNRIAVSKSHKTDWAEYLKPH